MTANPINARRNRYQGMESIEIVGPFDANDATLESLVRQILDEGQTAMVFDLSKTTYLTSAGIAALIKAIKWFHAVNGTVYLCGLTDDIREFLALSRIDAYVKFL